MNFELLKMKAMQASKMSETTYSAKLIQFCHPKHLSKFHFAYRPAIHSLSSKWSHAFQFPDYKFVCTSDISNYNNRYITLCK